MRKKNIAKKKSLEAAPSSLRLSAGKVVPTARHNGRRHQGDQPHGTIFGPRIEDEHELPRRAISSTLAENLLRLTNQPDYLANIVASAIRTD